MSKADKLLQKMRNNPRDWTLENVVTVCQQNGLDIRAGKGSHYVVSHPELSTMLTVPAHRPIKPIYIKKLIELIDQGRLL